MKSFFFRSNLILYSTHAMNFIFGYLFILICTNNLNFSDKFEFTGFVSLFNIFLIPITCLVISLTGLYKKEKINHIKYSLVYTRSLLIFISIIIFFIILDFFFSLNNFLQINPKYFFLIALLLLINFFYSLENAENLAKQNFFKYSTINTLPFLIRFMLVYILLITLKISEFYIVLVIYIISFSFLAHKYLFRMKSYFSIKNIFIFEKIEKLNFIKNFLTLSIFSIVINIDILAARYVDASSSTDFYIEALFGKIVFFLSTIAVLFMYPTNIQNEVKNFNKILILNFFASIFLIFFYFIGFEYLNFFLFPKMNLNPNVVLLVSFSSLLFSVSNLFSYKLNINGIYMHSIIKILLILILIPVLFNSPNIKELIKFLIIFSLLFTTVDIFFFLKLQKKINA